MFLFIFESIGTSELILVGLVALIFLGPRRLPEMARKFGKMMAEFRGTANEFKETWAREVNFEEEAKLLNLKELEAASVARGEPFSDEKTPAAPAIKGVDAAAFEELKRNAEKQPTSSTTAPAVTAEVNDKQNWL